MKHERTDTIEHLVADLRKNHPRLVLLIGERHDSVETRKLYKTMAKDADVGFFESPNRSKNPTGDPDDRGMRAQKLAEMRKRRLWRKPTEQQIVTTETMLVPKHAVFVDEISNHGQKLLLTTRAIERLEDNHVPASDPLMKSIRDIHTGRAIDRVASSNKVMGKTIADHLDANFPGDTPFFATFLVGNGHLRDLDTLNLESTESDISHTLNQRGYHTVALDIKPFPKITPLQKPGDYLIIPEYAKIGVDFSIGIVDPQAKKSLRGF